MVRWFSFGLLKFSFNTTYNINNLCVQCTFPYVMHSKIWVTPSLYMFKYIIGKKFHENGLIGYDDVNLKFKNQERKL